MKSTLRNAIYSLCLLIGLGPSLALAQSAPANLPSHTVYGRIGTPGDTGPGQAIPFATLKSQVVTAPLTLTPPAFSLTQGLVVNQSGPTSGTTAGPQNYNLISLTEGNNKVTASGGDAFGVSNGLTSAFRVNYLMSADDANPRIGGTFAINFTGSSTVAQPIGVFGSVYTAGRVQSMWGVIGNISVGATGQSAIAFPVVSEVSSFAGALIQYRSGFTAYSEGPVQGSVLDSVMTVAALDVGAGTPAGWKNVITLSTDLGTGLAPLDTTANFFSSQGAQTIGSFANLPNITVSGNILDFPNLKISGTGGAILGDGSTAAPASGLRVKSGLAAAFQVGANSGLANPAFQVDTSNGSGNGVYVFSTAAGSGAQITTISSGTNEDLKINAKGSGVVSLANASTGGVNISNGLTVTGSFTATGLVTSADLNANVFSTAHSWAGQQTFVAPILGTPASGVATNLTGTAAGLTAGNVTTNANMTGDVTSVGNATAIGANKVTRAMEAQGVARSVVGVTGNATANVADIQGSASQFLGVNSAGNALAFQTMSGYASLSGGTITVSAVQGTATNNNATAGDVGEYVESNIAAGSAVSLVTNTAKDMTTIPLTAGDWDVEYVPEFTGGATTTVTYLTASISTTANTLDQTNGRFSSVPGFAGAVFNIGAPTNALSAPSFTVRMNLSGATTVRAVAQVGFATSTASAYGLLRARRVR